MPDAAFKALISLAKIGKESKPEPPAKLSPRTTSQMLEKEYTGHQDRKSKLIDEYYKLYQQYSNKADRLNQDIANHNAALESNPLINKQDSKHKNNKNKIYPSLVSDAEERNLTQPKIFNSADLEQRKKYLFLIERQLDLNLDQQNKHDLELKKIRAKYNINKLFVNKQYPLTKKNQPKEQNQGGNFDRVNHSYSNDDGAKPKVKKPGSKQQIKPFTENDQQDVKNLFAHKKKIKLDGKNGTLKYLTTLDKDTMYVAKVRPQQYREKRSNSSPNLDLVQPL